MAISTSTTGGVRVLLSLAVVVATTFVVLARPADACSCVAMSDAMAFERADVVFVGEVQSSERTPVIGGDPPVWTFRVDEVFKGEAARTQGLATSASGGSCGLELPSSGRVLVFARHEPSSIEPVTDWDTLHGGLCDGSRVVADPLPADTFGTARAPTEGSAGLPPLRSSLTSARTLMAVAVAVILFAATATVLVVVRRRRPRA